VLSVRFRVTLASDEGTPLASAAGMSVSRYEDLVCWQPADRLKKEVYALVEKLGTKLDRRFYDQIRDSAASAPSNIAEGFGYFGHSQSARHARIAKASEMETHNHLGDGVDRGHWSAEEAPRVRDLAERAIKAVTGWHNYLVSTDAPGDHTPRRKPRTRTGQ
jgi:four helix bundle protein